MSFEARLLNVFNNQTQLVDRLAAVPGSADDSDAAVLRAVSAAEPVLRDRQRLRAAAPPHLAAVVSF